MATLDMTPDTLEIVVKAHTTWEWSFLWLDENESPIDNTGYAIDFAMRTEWGDTDPALRLSTTDGTITCSGSSGFLHFLAPASVTGVESQRYVFDVIATTTGGPAPVADGTLLVEDNVVGAL
jgi:hypothetical protein